MAHIFKKKNGKTKGIIVFTHKEMNFFESRRVEKRKLIKKPFGFFTQQAPKLIAAKKIRNALNKLKEDYIIGVHWGFRSEDVITPKWVDFHLAAPGTCTFKDNPFVIPLSSANFTPEIMRHDETVKKYWDIICVAKNDHKKKLPEFIHSIRQIYNSGHDYKVLLIVASNLNETKENYYIELLDDYYKHFNQQERELFTIIKSHPETGFQGYSYTFLAHLYNQSKVFTIFSQKEGECRVIKEAQMCGLPIIVKSDMEGGGRDYLNSSNSILFDDYANAHISLIKAVENYQSFSIDENEIRKDLGEKHSIDKLHDYFGEIYSLKGMVYDRQLINTDNLNRRLPAHYYNKDIVWANGSGYRFKTTDITSKSMFDNFLKAVNDKICQG